MLKYICGLTMLLVSTVAMASGAFETHWGPVPVLDDYKNTIETNYPDFSHEYSEGLETVYKGETYEAFKVVSEGSKSGYDYTQELTFAELASGVYYLVGVVVDSCREGEVMREGEWVTISICEEDESYMPLSKDFAALYLLESEDYTAEYLSEVYGVEVDRVQN